MLANCGDLKPRGYGIAYIVCLYVGHSINKVKYCLGGWQEEALCTVAPFSRKSIEMGPLMSQKTVSMAFFTDHYTWNLFFIGESVCFHFNSGF